MNYPEQITLDGEELEFWKAHSALISDLAEKDEDVILERSFFNIIGPGSQLVNENVYPKESSDLYWQLFVDLVEGNKVASFNKSGRALLDLRKGYTRKRLLRLLDYLAFPTNKASLDELKAYMSKKRIDLPLPTVPRGVGIRKVSTTHKSPRWSQGYRKYYSDRFFDNNNDNDNNNNNNSENKMEDLNEYKNNNDSILHLLPAGKYVPYAKKKKQRDEVKRRHTIMTKRRKQRNQKPAKTRRLAKSKNRKTNYWTNNMNYNMMNNGNEGADSLND